MILVQIAVKFMRFINLFFKPLQLKEKVTIISRQSDKPTLDIALLYEELKQNNIETVVLTKTLKKTLTGVVSYCVQMIVQILILPLQHIRQMGIQSLVLRLGNRQAADADRGGFSPDMVSVNGFFHKAAVKGGPVIPSGKAEHEAEGFLQSKAHMVIGASGKRTDHTPHFVWGGGKNNVKIFLCHTASVQKIPKSFMPMALIARFADR